MTYATPRRVRPPMGAQCPTCKRYLSMRDARERRAAAAHRAECKGQAR